jgi:integrase
LVRKVTGTLKAILAEAQRSGLATVNAASPVRVTLSRRDEEPSAIPQPHEVAALIDGAEDWFRCFLLVAALCGLRASELRGLPWSAVDFDKRTLRVFQRADEWGQIGPPKSAAGRREIPLASVVLNALREWKLACPKGSLGLVFPTRTGAPIRHSNIAGRHWCPLQRRVLGEVRFGLHQLRHYFASWIIASGFSPKRAQTLLGHSSITMTYDRYGHLFPSIEDDHARFAAGELLIRGGAA